ncbi:uncharacterized protein EI97DRAFT_458748 [Westerdykella ornata]|uniref:SUZ domain-containing protein n=1 Tax=Westerdykella ornata TaxID=318751 RepID=A0A6A6JJ42_WESOR|nr:uncharacterized protein EI97DRAFT_458748 [Westerdykella ornata]KAF2276264.1 hypothetical protein EI97DRAFT_458748 [Westerdykella ornata]
MSSKETTVPDAWDDDWEGIADTSEASAKKDQTPEPAKLTKAERRAKHAEFNRQIWQSAENPEPMLFLQAKDTLPIQPTFKPPVTVLSRKPPPKVLSQSDDPTEAAEDNEDSEEERRRKAEESFAERQARAERERAEKQRKYAEARERLFGSPAPSSEESRVASPSRPSRGKGRGRGGRDSTTSSNEQSPARPAASTRQLYDPSYTVKPNSVYIQRREQESSRSRPSTPGTPNGLQQPIREPRGPQAIGRGGRGFAPRGNHRGASG